MARSIFYEIAKEKSDEMFEKLMKVVRLHSHNFDHNFNTIATYNTIIKATKDIKANKDIDLIVMGIKGSTGSRSLVFGTNAIGLMDQINECPVLAIPECVSFKPPKEIIFPTDYKEPFQRRELKYLINIAKTHNYSIQILHIKESENLNRMQQINKNL